MRILYICADHGIPVFGRKGASTHVREMIAALRAEGHEVALAAANLGGDRRREEDFPVYALPAPASRKLGLDGRYILASWLAGKVLRRVVGEFRPEALFERSAAYFTAGMRLARQTGLPRIVEVNALMHREMATRLHFRSMARRAEMTLIGSADGLAVISRTMGRELEKLGFDPARIRPFPMAVDPKRFQPPDDPNVRRRELGWSADDFVVGYAGSMNAYHKPRRFVEFARKLLEGEGDKAPRFLFVGGSDEKVARYRAQLEQWVESGSVHFTGTVPQAEMKSWLAAMSVLLVPGAAAQSTPTKIFEAAAVGCPVILPATEPICEIAGAEAPFLFDEDSETDMAAKVDTFRNRPDLFGQALEDFRKRVLRDFTWENHARRIAEWFEELGIRRDR